MIKNKSLTVLVAYFLILISLTTYSYVLVDPNLTLINHPLWALFREKAVYIGYHRREISWFIYLVLLSLLFTFHYYFVKSHKKYDVLKLALLIAIALLLSYPFLSRDFFNYMFDARIFTLYQQNPYLHKALDFQEDSWLRFMHWTHRTYPYGPSWLPITLIPSFLSFGKFILNFIFFKGLFAGFYLTSVYFLSKIATTSGVARSDSPEVKHNRWAIFFATHPLVLIEGLVSSHNDLVAVALGIVGVYYLTRTPPRWLSRLLGGEKWKTLPARVLLLLSGGIKYITLPLVLLQKPPYKNKNSQGSGGLQPLRLTSLGTLGMLAMIAYLSLFREVQPWYFLNFFALLPFYTKLIYRFNIFFAGLLLAYYPYIRLGDWTDVDNVIIKHNIIIIFFVINVILLVVTKLKGNTNILRSQKI